MKQKIKFTILILILISLFIFRNDAVKAYSIVNRFIISEFTKITSENLSDNLENIVTDSTPLNADYQDLVDTPGALRVTNPIVKEGRLSRDNIIYITNLNREEVSGLKPLKENKTLNLSAEKKVEDMFDNQYFEHISPNGVGVSDLANNQGYEYIIIGENLALGNFRNDDAVVNAWMNSPGHRANILNTKYTEIGVAVGKGTFEGKNTWIIVQHFGLPKDACPKINEDLKIKIQSAQKKISTMESNLTLQKKVIDEGGVGSVDTNILIEKYNTDVKIFNTMISENKINVDRYNDMVRAFNSCVQSNT